MNKKENLINALEYCTVDRAARLLECEVNDLFHFAEIQAISFCIQVDRVDCWDSADIVVRVDNNDVRERRDKIAAIIKSVHGRDFEAIDTPYSAIGTLDSRPIKRKNIDGNRIGFRGDLLGFWEIQPYIFNSSESQPYKGKVSLKAYDPFEELFCMVSGKSPDDVEIHRDQILIMKPCLIKLFKAMHKGETLDSKFYEFATKFRIGESKTKQRTESGQSDMIAALLALMPDLKQELDAHPTKAPAIMNACLGKKELPLLNLGDNNYINWMKRAKYNKEN
ncbi:hypothetical protein DET48_12338 [Vibrio diazotrophicus]|uniref:Uncharacterized protein n=1 Tax=Vibrio diazotrophicus TaxID=685 RepID=A0A329E5J9_VIBDI|nr:hypothetical protein [Vibrio diazotrophicus]RAS60069.1 hypothetical protein DET48_12338 [Vibrio diazotrophicus]